MLKSLKIFRFSDGILLVSLALVGGFHEYISSLLSAVMCFWLLMRFLQEKQLCVHKNLLTVAVAVICLFYGLTCLWGVDSGMAFVGFLKFLPLILYLLCLQQNDGVGQALNVLPYFGALLAIVSAVGMQFPAVKSLFSVAGRLSGSFQYPNTFAVFLLVCQLLLLKKTGKKLWDYIALVIVVAGFLYTGSRTAFVLAIAANIAMLWAMSRKNIRRILLGGCVLIGILTIVLILSKNSILNRYLTISLTESTFVGRLLYWADALQLLLKYPLGMGYMGYFYTQQSVQTGVYSVAYVHNDLLQLILDVGLIPTGLFVAAVVMWFCKKDVAISDKIIVGAICLHSLFDFDMQFVGMFFLLLLFLSQEQGKKVLPIKPRGAAKVAMVALTIVSLYIGGALMLAHWGFRDVADRLYPYNTQNKLEILEQTEELEEANILADEILKQNKEFYAPYSIKARYFYSQGDFGEVIKNQRIALKKSPFTHTEYETYCKMLINGIDLYQKAGNFESANICKEELLAVAKQLSENKQRLSKLGRMIKDQPNTVLSDELQDYINKIGG